MQQVPRALGQFDRDQPIVVICHHGVRSLEVARYLEQQGFSRVINLTGGVAAWASDLDPAMPTY
jgi:rhodanese-related sulfurtransferase